MGFREYLNGLNEVNINEGIAPKQYIRVDLDKKKPVYTVVYNGIDIPLVATRVSKDMAIKAWKEMFDSMPIIYFDNRSDKGFFTKFIEI